MKTECKIDRERKSKKWWCWVWENEAKVCLARVLFQNESDIIAKMTEDFTGIKIEWFVIKKERRRRMQHASRHAWPSCNDDNIHPSKTYFSLLLFLLHKQKWHQSSKRFQTILAGSSVNPTIALLQEMMILLALPLLLTLQSWWQLLKLAWLRAYAVL